MSREKLLLFASLVLLGASLGVLGLVLLRRGLPEEGAPVSAVATPTRTVSPAEVVDTRVRYLSPFPLELDPDLFRAVTEEGEADIVVAPASPGEGGAVARRFFVPIVSPASGVYELSRLQVVLAMSGQADWAELGGLPGPAVPVGVPAPDAALLAGWLGEGFAPDAGPAGYGDVVATVARTAGAVSLVPLEFVDASVTALAVGGVDIVRGRGDPAAWPFRELVDVRALTPEGEAALEIVREAVAAVLPVPITVVLTGDILQSRCTLAKIEALGDWGAALRSPVGEFLAAADLALGSLDGSIQDIAPPWGCVETTNLSSPPETIEGLKLAGIDGLTVATNHVFDCGQVYCGNRAFLRTLELLDEAGIAHWGGGANLEEALAPGIFSVRGVTFGVLGFDDVAAYELEATESEPGTAPLDDDYSEERAAGEPSFYRPASELGLERFRERIAALGEQVDVVIVQVQSGTEETHHPSPRSVKALRAAVEAGADVVVGNQAHWVQAVEYAPSSFVAYALGNFIFDQVWTPEHTEGVLLEATFHGPALVNVRLRPYVIHDRYQPRFVDGERALKILADIVAASEALAAEGP